MGRSSSHKEKAKAGKKREKKARKASRKDSGRGRQHSRSFLEAGEERTHLEHPAIDVEQQVGEGAFGKMFAGKWRDQSCLVTEVRLQQPISSVGEKRQRLFYDRFFAALPCAQDLHLPAAKEQGSRAKAALDHWNDISEANRARLFRKRKILVVHGTVEGGASALAEDLAYRLASGGLLAQSGQADSMVGLDTTAIAGNECDLDMIAAQDFVVVVMSTARKGSPPGNLDQLFARLGEAAESGESPLADVPHAVIGFGNSDFGEDFFLKSPRAIEDFLTKLGSRPIMEPIYHDDRLSGTRDVEAIMSSLESGLANSIRRDGLTFALMELLDTMVGGLRDLRSLVPTLTRIGEKFALSGVTDEIIDRGRAALLAALEESLGNLWDRESANAWTNICETLGRSLKGARRASAKAESKRASSSALQCSGVAEPSATTTVTQAQAVMIREAFSCIRTLPFSATDSFYADYLAQYPKDAELFPSNKFRRRGKVQKMINEIAKTLPQMTAKCKQELRELGKLHFEEYESPASHFAGTRSALMTMLEKELKEGGKWNSDLRDAIFAMTTLVAEHMLAGFPAAEAAIGFAALHGSAPENDLSRSLPDRVSALEWIEERNIAIDNPKQALADMRVESLGELLLLDDAALKQLGIRRIGDRARVKAVREEFLATDHVPDSEVEDPAPLLSADIDRVQQSWRTIFPTSLSGEIIEGQDPDVSSHAERAGPGVPLETWIQAAKTILKLPVHDNVLQLVGVCRDPTLMILEYSGGGSLGAMLATPDCNLDDQAKLHLMLGIASGCMHLHRADIIHGYLAAESIILERRRVRGNDPKRRHEYVAKLWDFGITSLTGERDWKAFGSSNHPRLKWLAPEVFDMEGKLTFASDIWSFGLVCVEMLTEGPLWPGLPMPLFSQVAREAVVFASELIPKKTSEPLKSLLVQSFELDPDARLGMEALVNGLSDIVGES